MAAADRMISPDIAFRRFLTGLVLGCVLGIFYGFLRPVRRGKAVLSDLIFVLLAGWIYLYYGFAVCRGDLRMGYLAAPILGALAFDQGFGRWLRPVFDGFWRFFNAIFRPFQLLFKKIEKIIKFLFASWKKWGTIKRIEHQKKPPPSEGVKNGKQQSF